MVLPTTVTGLFAAIIHSTAPAIGDPGEEVEHLRVRSARSHEGKRRREQDGVESMGLPSSARHMLFRDTAVTIAEGDLFWRKENPSLRSRFNRRRFIEFSPNSVLITISDLLHPQSLDRKIIKIPTRKNHIFNLCVFSNSQPLQLNENIPDHC